MLLLNLKLAVFLISIQVLWLVQGQSALGFVLNGVTYPNGSIVLRTDIGEGDAALNCTTDRVGCCRPSDGRAGDFYFPNGDQVLNMRNSQSGYYRNRDTLVVRLHRRSVATETGQFRCEIPDASGTNVTLFINIVNSLPATTASETTTLPPTTTEQATTTEQTTTTELFSHPLNQLPPLNQTLPQLPPP